MAGNIQADSNGDILVEFDYNNIIIVDPNKTIDNFGNIKERLVDAESLVMYANLEVDVLPRTKLLVGTTPEAGVERLTIAKMNFLKPDNAEFMSSGYFDELTGRESLNQKGPNQPKKVINSINNNQTYTRLTVGDEDNIQDNGLLGITDINITTNSSFVPNVRIELEDVQGRALFQLGEKSPYSSFFTYPYPPFYLTIKGYYGQAVKYQLNLQEFNARFNSGTGNYQVSLQFFGYKFNILNEIQIGHLLAVPHMYNQTFNITSDPQQLQSTNSTTRLNATVQGQVAGSNSNSQDSLVSSITSERGYQKIREVYSEYKAKKLIPLDFPELTFLELLNKIEMFETQITASYPKVKIEPLTNIRQYKLDLKSYFDSVRGTQNSWFDRFLSPKPVILNNNQQVFLFKKNLSRNGIESAIEELKSTIKKNNMLLSENPTVGSQGKYKITNNISYEMLEIDVTPDEVFTIETVKRQTNTTNVTLDDIRLLKENYNDIYSVVAATTTNGEPLLAKFYTFDTLNNGEKRFNGEIINMEAEANRKLQQFESAISAELAEMIQTSNLGLGFVPTVRNIVAVIMASTEAFIRLLDEVHTKAWDVKYDEIRQSAIPKNDSTSAPGVDTARVIQLSNNSLNDNQGLVTAMDPVYPWPQFFVEETANDKKGRFQIKYLGDPSVVSLTKGYLYTKWPEVQFVEEYVKGLTQKFNSPQSPTPFDSEKDTNQININAIEYPQFGLSYLNKQEVKFFYEIWERQFLTANYSGLVRAVGDEINETLNLVVETEINNIKEALGVSNPYLIYILKNFGLNSQNYEEDALKNFSNSGTGRAYQDYIRDFFVTSYIKSITELPFSILGTVDLGKIPQVSTISTAFEKLVKSSNNTPLIIDTYPFTDSSWVSENMAGSITNSGNQVFNTNKSLKVFPPLNILSNFTDVYNFSENRPVTNFSYLTVKENPIPFIYDLTFFYSTRNPNKLFPTEGLVNYISPITNSLVNRTTSILNSPYFVNAILEGVQSQKNGNITPYVKASFLFINSLPLASTKEKYKSFLNNTEEELDYIASVFKKFGAIHKVPYVWTLKIGSIWHRYKKYKETNIDILQDVWTNFDYVNNYSPIQNNIEQSYTFQYQNKSYNIILQKETDSDISMSLGFYPKVINDFNYFYNGYNLYSGYTNEEIQQSFSQTGIKIFENSSANIVLANQSGKSLNETLYSVIIPDFNLIDRGQNCDLPNNNTSLEYYIVPSFGSNLNQAYYELINSKTSYVDTVTPFTNNSSVYNGSVRTFWASPNYGYFNSDEIVKPNPEEYINEFVQTNQQYPFKLLTESSYSKIEEIFSIFEKSMLDQFETEFLDFCRPATNIITKITSKTFNEPNPNLAATFRNFQALMKSMMTVTPQTDVIQLQSNQEYFDNIVNLQLNNISSQIKGLMNYDVIIRFGNPSGYRRRIFDSYRSHNSNIKYVTDPIPFNPYVVGTLPSKDGNVSLQQSKTINPEAWLALELEVGFSTIPNLVYSSNGSYITDFFIDNNIEFDKDNVTLLSPIIKMYATQKLSGVSVSTFKQGLTNYFGQTTDLQNNILNLILQGLNKPGVLPNISQVPEGAIQSVVNSHQGKIEIYELFKAINDKWIAGGNFSEKTLFEDILFLDKASRNIGDVLYLDIFDLKKILNKNSLNEGMGVYTFIFGLLVRNNFTVMNLPSYVNFYNVQDVSDATVLKQEGSLEFANSMWGTFLNVDYRKSSQKMVCFYIGKPSEHLPLLDSGFRNDGFDFGKPDCPLIEDLSKKPSYDYALSNRCVGFTVDIGIRNQNVFHTFSIDQSPGLATSESISTFLDMVNQENGRSTATQNVGLYNLYKSRSYQCTVSCLGNAMIQPTMYFNLRHVPLFYGPYMITEVGHSIQGGSFVTTFKGTRQSIYDLPAIDNLLQQINTNLLTRIEEAFKIRKDSPPKSEVTDAQKANNVSQKAENTIAEQNSCVAKLDVAYSDRQYVSKETVPTPLSPLEFAKLLNNRFGNEILLKTTIYCMCYVRTFQQNGNSGAGTFYGYDNNFITLSLTKSYGDVGFNIFNRTYSCVNIKPNESEPIANFETVNDFLTFMQDRLSKNLKRIENEGLLVYYLCGWNNVSPTYYKQNFQEFNALEENFFKAVKSAVDVNLITEKEARLLGLKIVDNQSKQIPGGPIPTPTPSPNPPLPGQDCPPPIINSFYPSSGGTGTIIQINGKNLLTTNKININNVEVDMQLTQIFNGETMRFSVPSSPLPLPQVGKIKVFTLYGSVESSTDFTHL